MFYKQWILRKIFFIFFCLYVSTAYARYSGGTGEPNDPYLIATPEDINNIGTDSNDWCKCFKLIDNINMANYGESKYKIIGNAIKKFTGTFDGDGYAIIDLIINTSEIYSGIFGCTENAIIKNLSLENCIFFSSGQAIGGIVGLQSNGIITDCHSSVEITSSNAYAGGIVGRQSSGEINGCYNIGNITSSHNLSGGLIGYQNSGTISNSYNLGSIISSYSHAGGLIGYQKNGIINNSYNAGTIMAKDSPSQSCAGGLIGFQYNGTITDSHNSGMIKAYDCYPWVYAGGLVGRQLNGDIANCYNEGKINASSQYRSYCNCGGLVGQQTGTITNCFNTGDVNSSSPLISNSGGVAGGGDIIRNSSNYGTITASGGRAYAGGIIGGGGTITNCFNTGNIISSSGSFCLAGGLVGLQGGSISECYNNGMVTCLSASFAFAGGLVGEQSNSITDCYALNDVSALYSSFSYAGGLVGSQDARPAVKTEKCYFVGKIFASGTFTYEGALISNVDANEAVINNCFWDKEISGPIDGIGTIDPDPNTIAGKTTAEMKTHSTFIAANWDFSYSDGNDAVWFMQSDEYPILTWQISPADIYTDGKNNFKDWAIFANYWQREDCHMYNEYCEWADLDFNGSVDIDDLIEFISYWLEEGVY